MPYIENKKASGLETLDSSTIENADLSIVGDVSDSSRAKAITFTNIKAFLKIYFDPIYQAILGLTSNVSGTGYTLTGGATPKTLTLSNDTTLNGGTHSGTNTGDQTSIVGITGTKAQFDTAVTDGNFLYVGDITLPVKATGAELDTGTDDAKFATAKAIKDSKNVPSVAPGTSGNVLTSDGTNWISQTPSGSGEWTYVSKKTFSASSTQQDFTSLASRDFYKLVFSIYNGGNSGGDRINLECTVNGLSSGFQYITKTSSGISGATGQSAWRVYGTGGDSHDRFDGEMIITGKPRSGDNAKTFFANGSGAVISGSVAISGNIKSDNNNISSIEIIPNNPITGTVELWYKDSK